MEQPTAGQQAGWIWGFLGVLGFSVTLPATHVAVPWLGPTLVGFGRSLMAAVVAGLVLVWRRDSFPRHEWRGLLWVMGGVILGFPWLSAYAMARVPAVHGAVMLALLPLATAGAGSVFAHERPSRVFWVASLLGAGGVLTYALLQGAGHFQRADIALIAAVVLAAGGYAEGGRLARTLGGFRVIAWALVCSVPVTIGPVLAAALSIRWTVIPLAAWGSFVYVALISQLLAFLAWYRGLATGGIARISQIQYLQVFLTLGWSAWWLGEPLSWTSVGAALFIVGVIAWGKQAPIRPAVKRAPTPDPSGAEQRGAS